MCCCRHHASYPGFAFPLTTSPSFGIDEKKIDSPECVAVFKDHVSNFVSPGVCSSVDEHLHGLVDAVKDAAELAFGRDASERRPRKSWISDSTWENVVQLHDVKRYDRAAQQSVRFSLLLVALHAWRTVSCSESRQADGHAWRVFAHVPGYLFLVLRPVQVAAALARRTLAHCQSYVRNLLKVDRDKQWQEIVMQAARAAENNDMRSLYQMVRRLSIYRPRAIPAIRRKDGTLADSPEASDGRWLEHFADLFIGSIDDASIEDVGAFAAVVPHDHERKDDPCIGDVCPVVQSPCPCHRHQHHPRDAEPPWSSIDIVQQRFDKMNPRKAKGPDEVSSMIWKAGQEVTAVKVHALHRHIHHQRRVPSAWKGGRLAKLRKGDKDPSICDNSRGLLIGDRIGKHFTALLMPHVEPAAAVVYLPEEQCGGARGKGTNRVTLVSSQFISYTLKINKVAMILFLDLSKAFDKVVREMVMKIIDDEQRSYQAIRELGLPPETADHIISYLQQQGTIFEQLNIDPVIAKLVAYLHDGTWFVLEQSSGKVIKTRLGSRQGCRFGGLVFNLLYAVALRDVRQQCSALGLCLNFQFPKRCPPWNVASTDGTLWEPYEMLDVTFVDDEAFMLMADSCDDILRDGAILLDVLQATLPKYGMTINWEPGKTEALVLFRGYRSRKILAELPRHPKTDQRVLKASLAQCVITRCYKHVGTHVNTCGNLSDEVAYRLKKAKAVFGQLTKKVLTSAKIDVSTRISLLFSLVFSVLLYNSETWDKLTLDVGRKIQHFYVYALSRTTRTPVSFVDSRGFMSDREFLNAWNFPSINCLIMRRRLKFYAALLHSPSSAILCLGQAWSDTPSQWAMTAADDLLAMQKQSRTLSVLGDPRYEWRQWVDFIVHSKFRWKYMVNAYFENEVLFRTETDVINTCISDKSELANHHVCTQCPVDAARIFSSIMALRAHLSSAHGHRKIARLYIASDNKCPSCHKVFRNRKAAVVHLQRVQSCAEFVESGECNCIPLEELQILEPKSWVAFQGFYP